jgi:tetraacyldisaccharide 4'-kinase
MILFKIIISPFSLIYWKLSSSRNVLFEWGLLKQYKSRIPVISVGNLCMGGSGKTPHVALILEHLTDYNKAVISRGYGRKNKVLIEANTEIHSTKDTGDEPMELLEKFEGSSFKMIIDSNRKNAIRHLEMHREKTDIVVLDDGYQHQYVKRDLNILLTDFSNPFYKDFVLPIGRLREHRKAAKRADIIIVTKCPKDLNSTLEIEIKKKIRIYSSAKIFFTNIKYEGLINHQNKTRSIDTKMKYLLITSIANPNSIYEYLIENKVQFTAKKYRDHHNFTKTQIQEIIKINRQYDAIITTEKDWMRLRETELVNTVSIDILD